MTADLRQAGLDRRDRLAMFLGDGVYVHADGANATGGVSLDAHAADDLIQLLQTVAEIAERAPAKQGAYVFAAQIPWSLIHRLRRRLARAAQ